MNLKKELSPTTRLVVLVGLLTFIGLFLRTTYHYTAPDLYKSSDGFLKIQDPDSYYFLWGTGLNAWIVQNSIKTLDWLLPKVSLEAKTFIYTYLIFSLILLVLCYCAKHLVTREINVFLMGLFFILNARIWFITNTGFLDYDLILLLFGVLLVWSLESEKWFITFGVIGVLYFFWNGWIVYFLGVLVWIVIKYWRWWVLFFITPTTYFIYSKILSKIHITQFNNILELQQHYLLNLKIIDPLLITSIIILVVSVIRIRTKFRYFFYVYGILASFVIPKLISISLIPLFFIIPELNKKTKIIILMLLVLQVIITQQFFWYPLNQDFQNTKELEGTLNYLDKNKTLVSYWHYNHYFNSKGFKTGYSGGEPSQVLENQLQEKIDKCDSGIQLITHGEKKLPDCYKLILQNDYYNLYTT